MLTWLSSLNRLMGPPPGCRPGRDSTPRPVMSAKRRTVLTARPSRAQDGRHRAMTIDAVRATPAPLEVARALAPRIRARADEIEASRQLPPDLVMELANARLFKVALPEAEGGLGADVITALQVIEEVARADGSTGWCLAMAI